MAVPLAQPDDERGVGGVPIGTEVSSGEDVVLRYEDRDLGTAIIGKSGTGKSSLMERMILADMANGTPGMVIDPHGLLAHRVLSLAPADVAHRLFLLEVDETCPFGLNLLDVDRSRPDYITWAADSVIQTVKKLYGEADDFMPRLEKYLDLAVRALIPSNRTLVDVPRLFRERAFRQACLRHVTDEDVIGEFRVYDSLRPGEQAKEVEAVVNRLGRVLRSAAFRKILGAKKTTVPFDEVLRAETMLVVSLPSEVLSPDRCDFIGSMLLCALADRIFAQSAVTQLRRMHLYLDEYQRFATTTTQELLTQGRKFQAGVTMAHQDLYSIPDPTIRNASRHAGTMILLGVTYPDAQELAGEFPISPREEWIETIIEEDGTEPKLALSSTPAEDVFVDGHTDPQVDLAARSFFYYSPVGSCAGYVDKRKSAGVWPRPGGVPVDKQVQLIASSLNALLGDAMAGNLSSPEALLEALMTKDIYLGFANCSPSIVQWNPCTCWTCSTYGPIPPLDMRYPPAGSAGTRIPCRKNLTPEQKAHNEAVGREFDVQRDRLVQKGLRPWLLVHLQHADALRTSRYIDEFREADKALQWTAQVGSWSKLFEWQGGLPSKLSIFFDPCLAVLGKDDPATLDAIDLVRQRVRWLVILCKGLEREPIYIQTGEQQRRTRTSHIVHPRQTEQDALNEFTNRLAHPPERYVAHVRLPTSYHQVKLVPSLRGVGDLHQVAEVRQRSQAEYGSDDRNKPETPPTVPPPTQAPPPISRRPPNDPDVDSKNVPEEEVDDDDN